MESISVCCGAKSLAARFQTPPNCYFRGRAQSNNHPLIPMTRRRRNAGSVRRVEMTERPRFPQPDAELRREVPAGSLSFDQRCLLSRWSSRFPENKVDFTSASQALTAHTRHARQLIGTAVNDPYWQDMKPFCEGGILWRGT